MEYTIYHNGVTMKFENVYLWNLAIMSFLFEDEILTSYKDGFGGCTIE